MRLWVYALDFEGLQEYCNATFLFRRSILEAPFSKLGGDYPGWNFWLTFYSPSRQMPRQYLYYTMAASLQSPSNSSFINRSTIWDTDSVVKYRTLNSVTGIYKRCKQCFRIYITETAGFLVARYFHSPVPRFSFSTPTNCRKLTMNTLANRVIKATAYYWKAVNARHYGAELSVPAEPRKPPMAYISGGIHLLVLLFLFHFTLWIS